MQEHGSTSGVLPDKTSTAAVTPDAQGRSTGPKSASLPFVVKVVRTEVQMRSVCELRAQAYGVRNPALGALLAQPEPADQALGVITLIAEEKATGVVVGSVRIHTNLYQSLPMQGVAALPDRMHGCMVAEVCRFVIKQGFNDSLLRPILFKTAYLYCYANQVQHMIVLARNPLNQIYQAFGCKPMFGTEETWLPVSYASDLAHSFLSIDIIEAERQWHASAHPFYDFMGRTFHPDIQIFSAVNSAWARPRAAESRGAQVVTSTLA